MVLELLLLYSVMVAMGLVGGIGGLLIAYKRKPRSIAVLPVQSTPLETVKAKRNSLKKYARFLAESQSETSSSPPQPPQANGVNMVESHKRLEGFMNEEE